MKKKPILIAVVALIVAGLAWRYFPRPHRPFTPPPSPTLDPKALAAVGAAYAKDVEPIFKRSCFDCHSKFTVWPWYHSLPGVKQYLDGHVEEGRHDLDLSDGFPFNREVAPMRQLRRIAHVVKEKDMPLWDYALMHKDARLSPADRDLIVHWAEDGYQKLSATAKD